jgi:hypothetical protein
LKYDRVDEGEIETLSMITFLFVKALVLPGGISVLKSSKIKGLFVLKVQFFNLQFPFAACPYAS